MEVVSLMELHSVSDSVCLCDDGHFVCCARSSVLGGGRTCLHASRAYGVFTG